MGDEPLYRRDGVRFVPSAHTRGPWDPSAQHAGAPAALLAGAVESALDPGLRVARLAYDVNRPVPLDPCTVRVEVTRPGRRVCGLRAVLAVGDQEPMAVSAVGVRVADTSAGARAGGPPPFPGPAAGRQTRFPFGGDAGAGDAFHLTGMDVRLVRGAVDRPGPATAWFRLRRPVVDGDEPSPLQRVAAAADFANGVSWEVDPADWLFLNVDLVVHVARHATGDWVALDAVTHVGPDGSGFAEGGLWDATGPVGRCAQALFVDRRPC